MNTSLKASPSANRWNTLITRTTLVATDDWKKKRDDLKAKRNSLFDDYLKRPHDFQLASAIKPIDDEIAVCTEKMNQNSGLLGATPHEIKNSEQRPGWRVRFSTGGQHSSSATWAGDLTNSCSSPSS